MAQAQRKTTDPAPAQPMTQADLAMMNRHVTADKPGVTCYIDNALVHSVPLYLATTHPKWGVEEYQAIYGAATPLFSETYNKVRAKRLAALKAAKDNVTPIRPADDAKSSKEASKVFGINPKLMKNKRGDQIKVTVLNKVDKNIADMIPEVEDHYVFDASLTKDLILAMELVMPLYFWGPHGTGKTSAIEQFCARTGRPHIRVQHTMTTEEAHIVGQYVLKNGSTEFEPGPLAYAMRHGLVYIADEYDFAMPNVTAAYQPVLEGKALTIKDAPPEWRIVRPHPNFRFAATGNTNGSGDDSGLYQGTQVQNAANYSRFGVTREVGYMSEAVEAEIITKKTDVEASDARKMVSVATEIRKGFKAGKLSATISPREIFNAARSASARGGAFREGLALAWTNRLSEVDRVAADAVIQRTFP